MTYSPVLVVHICGGILGVISGFVAVLVRKGSLLHRRSGDVFVISMLCMAAAGAYVAFLKSQVGNVIGGIFTFYLVATAFLTVTRKPKETGRLEVALLVLGLATGIGSLIVGWEYVENSASANGGGAAVGLLAFGVVALLSTAGDIRLLLRGGVSGAKRLVRHLWRMGFALFAAVASFFLGTASDPAVGRSGLRATLFTPAIRKTHLPEVPVLIVVVLTIFWLFRVWFSKAYKSPKPDFPSVPDGRRLWAISLRGTAHRSG